jgi:hypothetical protein
VTDLAAVQEDGFVTLSWNPVQGTDYQVATAALDADSERVRVVEISRTLQGRPINSSGS